MKRFSHLFAGILVLAYAILNFSHVNALSSPATISIQPTPPPVQSPDLLITSIITSSSLDYLELYNQGDTAIKLDGWQFTYVITDSDPAGCGEVSIPVALPAGWMLPGKYLTLQRYDISPSSELTVPFTPPADVLSDCIAPRLASIQLLHPPDDPLEAITLPAAWPTSATTVAQHRQRNNAPSTTRVLSGSFDSDYKIITGGVTLNSDPLYMPPVDAAGLQVLEILPNARTCPPLGMDATCSDYVKLYNPTDAPINLAAYRLRVGYKGQNTSASNTFTWGQAVDPTLDELILLPHTYFMLMTRNDGSSLNLPDSGNYIWIEDAYGVAIYEPIVQYPDAGSATKLGAAWAFDGAAWRWTTTPQPGAVNYFPPEPPTQQPTIQPALKPCGPDQYRNPLTNRCNTVATVATLTPCGPGQERNPETNRCRSVLAASTELTPCQPGWERNPETNRCRKSTLPAVQGAATTSVKDVAAPSSSDTSWVVAVAAVTLAAAYGVYEWRQDIALAARHARERLLRVVRK